MRSSNVKTQTFDSLGRKIRIEDPNAGVWTFLHDSADNLLELIDGRG